MMDLNSFLGAGRLEFSSIEPPLFGRKECSLPLSPYSIRICAFNLAAPDEVRARCREWLSRAEEDRAARFRFEQDRDWYVVAHGVLRYVLGFYCGIEPPYIEIEQDANGKPRLTKEAAGNRSIAFSLSHSRGRALVAVAEGREVGVDLEPIRNDVEHLRLAERFFSPAERRAIAGAPPGRQAAAFFRHWVAKEAVLKAIGVGLQFPLERCEVTIAEDERTASVRWRDAAGVESSWTVRFLPLEAGWIGAVAALGTDWSVECDNWLRAIR